MRLTVHETRAQVTPVAISIPWRGFVVFPDHRRVTARKVRFASRHLRVRYAYYRAGILSFAEFDATVSGRINHVRYADTWGLRGHVLEPFVLEAGDAAGASRRCAAVNGTSAVQWPVTQ